MAYLFVKNRQEDPLNIATNAMILGIVIDAAFTSYIHNIPKEEIGQVLSAEFPEMSQISEKSEAFYKR